jgi:hypothetical protein
MLRNPPPSPLQKPTKIDLMNSNFIVMIVAIGGSLAGCATVPSGNPMADMSREAARERVMEQILSVVRLPYYPVLLAFGISPWEGMPAQPYSKLY